MKENRAGNGISAAKDSYFAAADLALAKFEKGATPHEKLRSMLSPKNKGKSVKTGKAAS